MSEFTLRRRLADEGLQLRKIPERSRWYAQYGPYMIVNADNNIVDYALDLEAVAAQVA